MYLAERVESAVKGLSEELGKQHVWVSPNGLLCPDLLYFLLFCCIAF